MKPKIIAFYLPQFHPVDINDKLYGKGFTEWRNVACAKKMYPGHYQPHIPADLGFYDLRLPEIREAQAKLASAYGIYGFCYWHYWLGNGVEFLEKPVNEIMRIGKPDFPFCLAWANHDWKSNTLTSRSKILIKQEYPGKEDYIRHFYSVLPCFKDHRYITMDGKPIFMIYNPVAHKDIPSFIELWQSLAIANGLKGIFFIGHLNNEAQRLTSNTIQINKNDLLQMGFDVINTENIHTLYFQHQFPLVRLLFRGVEQLFRLPHIIPYRKAAKYFISDIDKDEDVYPTLIPNWDNTPRRKTMGIVFSGSSPQLFKKHMIQVFETIKHKPESRKFVFLKSWNEWAEGNYVEPDLKFGMGYLEAIKETLEEYDN